MCAGGAFKRSSHNIHALKTVWEHRMLSLAHLMLSLL